jgi:circadian clock protein KaiC
MAKGVPLQAGTWSFYTRSPSSSVTPVCRPLPLDLYVKAGLIELIWQPPLEHIFDSLAESLLEKIRETSEPRRRLLIDGIEGFRAASVYPDGMPRFCPHAQPGVSERRRSGPVAAMRRTAEPELHRLVSIMTMRESRYDTSIREFQIADDGLKVAASFESAEAILSRHARVADGAKVGRS